MQLISDNQRGSNWINTIVNAQAKELILCGELRAFKHVKKMLEIIGESIELVEFQRRSILEVETSIYSHPQVYH